MSQIQQQKIRVDLQSVQQTLLITLYAKAMESRMADSILSDVHADTVMQQINFDFSKLKIHRDQQVSLACRAKNMDDMARQFLAEHSDALVIDLGCGLDTRYQRLDISHAVMWVNVDFAPVLALREKLFAPCSNVVSIASSLDDARWLEQLPADRPTLLIAEGVLPYLTPRQLSCLFTALSSHFAKAQMFFDAYDRLGTWLLSFDASIRATGASLQSSLRDLRLQSCLRLMQRHDLYHVDQLRHFACMTRSLIRCWQTLPMLGGIAGLYQCRL